MHDSTADKCVTDLITNLERLSALRNTGALSDDEFAKLKAELLSTEQTASKPAPIPATAPMPLAQVMAPEPSSTIPMPGQPFGAAADPSDLVFRTDWESRAARAGAPGGAPQPLSQGVPSRPFGMPIPPPPPSAAPTSQDQGADEDSFELTCPVCGTVWELEAADMALTEFECEDCGCRIPTDQADYGQEVALVLTCPQCKTGWELNQAEAELSEFVCEDCGCHIPTDYTP